ncbi:MAG: NAD-dependent epimerase/dehydratase family protein [Clostridia bacterium]|nr:NAD-dependent epimerase/dehydratase family protein [Clostridia bacterium]
MTDSVLREDMSLCAKTLADNGLLADLTGKTVFITGATGLIGSQMVRTLLGANRLYGAGITVAAFIRNEQKARALFEDLLPSEDLEFVIGDLSRPIEYDRPVDYVVHGASATGSRFFVESPVETIQTAIYGTDRLLQFARDKQVRGMVYLSSLEVYGVPDGTRETITESDYGFIEPLSVRSSYSEGKRMVECLCASYASEYGVPVKVARLSQTFGAGVEYNDGRVFAEFARCLMERRDIVLHTDGSTVRSYCYTADAVCALYTILLKGEDGQAYNVTNMDTACSIKEMAELVAGLEPEAGVKVRIEIPEDLGSFGYNPQMVIRLDAARLKALGYQASVGIEDMFRRTIRSMRERI